MPIYEYRCRKGHQFEVFRAMSDEPVSSCPQCGAAVERVFHPVAVHFKGPGFYTTDYARKASAKAGESSDGKPSEGGGSDSSKRDKKTAAASSTKDE